MLNQISSWLGGIPIPAVLAVLVLAVVQIVLQVMGLIDLAKRRSVLLDRKWIWIVVIIAGNLLGAIVYWAIARTEPAIDESQHAADSKQAKQAIETLYSSKDTE